MKCRFIDKYVDKIYTGSLNPFEEIILQSHMKKCAACRGKYESLMDEDYVIKEALECTDVPSGIGINIMKNIDTDRYKKRRAIRIRKYISASAVIILLFTSSFYILNRSGKLNSFISMLNPNPSFTYLQTQELEGVLEDYLKEKEGKAEHGGKLFATVEVLDVKKSSIISGTIKVYTFAAIGEYSYNECGPQGMAVNALNTFPAVVIVRKNSNSYTPVSYEVPGKDGSLTDNLKELYKDYGSKMTKQATMDLGAMNNQKAEEGFIPPDSTVLQKNIRSFLSSFKLAPRAYEYKQQITIPSTFKDKPGDYPLGLYWAYSNVLSKDAGLDMASYKGSEVTAHIVPLYDEYWIGPNTELRAIVLESGGKIIGGWLDKGRCGGPITSLNKAFFSYLTNKSWGQWLEDEGLVDYSTGLEAQLKKLPSEEIIKKYFSAMDKDDYTTEYALLSKACQWEYLTANMDDHKLYNDRWVGYGPDNVISSKLLKIEPWNNPYDTPYSESINQPPYNEYYNRKISQSKKFVIQADMQYKEEITNNNGKNRFFITLVKETPNSPWEIDGIGSGP